MKTKPGLFSLLSRLGKDTHASSPRLLARLLRDEEGSYLLYMTLVIPILIGVAGLGTEAGLAFYNHRMLQSAADAAAYSAAIAYSNDSTADITTQAEAIFASYGFVIGTGNNQVNVPAPTITKNYAKTTYTAIQVTATRPQLPILSSLYLKSAISVGGSATAVIDFSGSGSCVLALGKTATGNNAPDAIQLQGNPTINLGTTCGVFSNSTDCSKGAFSVALGGNANIDAGSLGAAGCVSVGGNSKVNLPGGGTYTQNDGQLMNPYAGITIPTTSTAGSCTATTSVGTTKKQGVGVVQGSGTLCPGVYSTGITVTGGITVTLQPGIYILDGSSSKNSPTPFQVGPGSSGNTVIGNGVTLVFTSADGTYPGTMMSVASNSSVNLTAPSSGSTAGFVIMGDSAMPLGTIFNTQSNPNVTMDGTVYVPNGAFSWGGNPVSGGAANFCLQFIVNTITLYGDSAFSNAGCSMSGGQKPIGSIVTLVE